jgi:AcrR family transcriptional regulator
MTTTAQTREQEANRPPLTRERVFAAAVAVADTEGIDGLTMRRLAEELDVEAMSLYYHVPNKEAVLDGAVDHVMGELEETLDGFKFDPTSEWKRSLRSRILVARDVMLRHPWAPAVFESRTTISPTTVRYFDAMVGIMREGGLSNDLCHHAMHALGSRALGFSPELFEPDDDGAENVGEMLEQAAKELPYLVGMLAEVAHDDRPDATLGWCDDQTEFEFGLDLLLDGLERIGTAGS